MLRRRFFPSGRKTTGISFDRSQHEQLERIAEQERTFVAAIVRRAVDAYLRTAYPREQLEAIRERAGADAADEGEA